MKKNNTIEGFEFFELERSACRPYSEKYPHKGVFTVRKSYCYGNSKIKELLQIKKGDRIIVSKKQDEFYLAVLPFDSKINGYKANINNYGIYFGSECLSKRLGDDVFGVYLLDEECIHVGGIDFYYLEKAE